MRSFVSVDFLLLLFWFHIFFQLPQNEKIKQNYPEKYQTEQIKYSLTYYYYYIMQISEFPRKRFCIKKSGRHEGIYKSCPKTYPRGGHTRKIRLLFLAGASVNVIVFSFKDKFFPFWWSSVCVRPKVCAKAAGTHTHTLEKERTSC